METKLNPSLEKRIEIKPRKKKRITSTDWAG